MMNRILITVETCIISFCYPLFFIFIFIPTYYSTNKIYRVAYYNNAIIAIVNIFTQTQYHGS